MSVFIISIGENDALFNSDFVKALREAGMKVKVLGNCVQPHVKTNSNTGQKYVGDLQLQYMLKDSTVWETMSKQPAALGCLASHVNCWYESLQEDAEQWCWVMEEDVVPHANSLLFLVELLEAFEEDTRRLENCQYVHLVNNELSTVMQKKLIDLSKQHMKLDHAVLLTSPRSKGHTVQVGQGTRSYMIGPDFMKYLTSINFKWTKWIDLEALG